MRQPFPGDADAYPTRERSRACLEQYAETFALPIQLDSAVKSLTEGSDTFVRVPNGATCTISRRLLVDEV